MNPLKKKVWFVAGIVTFNVMLAGAMVQVAQDREQPAPEGRTKVVTETVTKVETVYRLSEACETALAQAGVAGEAAKSISDVTNIQLDLISRTRVAIGIKDADELTAVTEEQFDLDVETSEAAARLVESLDDYEDAMRGCQQSVQ